MSGCVSCGSPTPRRKCRECERSDRLEERAVSEEFPECPSCGGPTSREGVECYRCCGDRVETDGGEPLEEPVYNVVCHDCDYEDVLEGDRSSPPRARSFIESEWDRTTESNTRR